MQRCISSKAIGLRTGSRPAGFNMQGCRLPQDRAKILGVVIAHYREYSAK